jgi:hypothetical protein
MSDQRTPIHPTMVGGGGGVGLILIDHEHHQPFRAHTVQLVNIFIAIFSVDDNANGRLWHS